MIGKIIEEGKAGTGKIGKHRSSVSGQRDLYGTT